MLYLSRYTFAARDFIPFIFDERDVKWILLIVTLRNFIIVILYALVSSLSRPQKKKKKERSRNYIRLREETARDRLNGRVSISSTFVWVTYVRDISIKSTGLINRPACYVCHWELSAMQLQGFRSFTRVGLKSIVVLNPFFVLSHSPFISL